MGSKAETTGDDPGALVHVSDDQPGISRKRAGRGFSYRDADGRVLSGETRARIEKLGIPPAWQDVWICPDPNGHIQATGRDARGRKQYRYHPLWSSAQAETKFDQLVAFGRALPSLRRRLLRDLRDEAGDKGFTLAALTMLLDRAYLRIGNAAYTAQNRSFGATTLLRRHLRFRDAAIHLSFRAKGGKPVRQTLRDKRLLRILQQIGDLPGRNLFTYLDAGGRPCVIGSADVNLYLAEAAGEGLTAKTFRTWGGTLAAFETALATGRQEALTIRAMAEAAAERLQNTAAISRKSYIHPAILNLTELPPEERFDRLERLQDAEISGLRRDEARLVTLLEDKALRDRR